MFDNVEFTGRVAFTGAMFNGDVTFSNAKFRSQADFRFARFDGAGAVLIMEAVFEGDTDFSGAEFMKECSFQRSIFGARVGFEGTKFKKVSFSECTFQKTVIIKGYGGPFKVFPEYEVTNFQNVTLEEPERVVLSKVCLKRCAFKGTDLRKGDLADVDWPRHKGRTIVYDEIYEFGWDRELIAKLYRQLKRNYEENRDFATAGDFHISEMEMRRLQGNNWISRNLSLIAFYKYVSVYGESYRRAAIWLFGWLLLFSTIFLTVGFKYKAATIRYTPNLNATGITTLTTPGFWRDFLYSVSYTLCIFSFQRDRFFEPLTAWGRDLEIVTLVSSATIVALFLLAVRRRFRR